MLSSTFVAAKVMLRYTLVEAIQKGMDMTGEQQKCVHVNQYLDGEGFSNICLMNAKG